MPVKQQLPGDLFDRTRPASFADIEREALGVEGIVRQEVQSLALHGAAHPTDHTTNLELQVDPHLAIGQVAYAPCAAVVPPPMSRPALSANRFFPRRTRRTTRACGSPNNPTMACRVRNPGNVYASVSRRRGRVLRMRISCQKSRHLACVRNTGKIGSKASRDYHLYPHVSAKSHFQSPTVRCSPRLPLSKCHCYYCDTTREIGRQVYRRDIVQFGYDFDNSRIAAQIAARDTGALPMALLAS